MNRKTKLLTAFILITVFVGCMPPSQGSLETGFSIWGYVGNTTTEPAANVMVLLVDGNTDKPIASKTSNFLGKYTFSGLRPGYYKIRISGKEIEAVISTENQRIDIDLSAESGSSGSWSIKGNAQQGTITIKYRNGSTSSIKYQQSNDNPQCYYFDSRLHCYNGACK